MALPCCGHSGWKNARVGYYMNHGKMPMSRSLQSAAWSIPLHEKHPTH